MPAVSGADEIWTPPPLPAADASTPSAGSSDTNSDQADPLWTHPTTDSTQDAKTTENPAATGMLTMMRQAVQRRPKHSDSWRLLARLETKAGNRKAGKQALQTAIKLDPRNAAAHFDQVESLLQDGDHSSVVQHHTDLVFEIAPDSSYAKQLRTMGLGPTNVGRDSQVDGTASPIGSTGDGLIAQAGYEIQTFDAQDDFEQSLERLQHPSTNPDRRINLEFGGLYNSNVSLTPISRQFSQSDAASFQGTFVPDMEWTTGRKDNLRWGPLARGNFTVNESDFSAFDLASFQPGFFLEHDTATGGNDYISRLEYGYSLDLLDGDRFGDRHSLTGSVLHIRPDLDIVYAYASLATSSFASDGTNPALDSLDGLTWSGGLSRFFQTGWARMPLWSAGIALEHADTEGDNFRYNAVNFNLDTTIELCPRWSLQPSAGIGYRDYVDFSGPGDRDELTWRAGLKLKYQINQNYSISLVGGYDRFASDNDQFDAERTQVGLISTISW